MVDDVEGEGVVGVAFEGEVASECEWTVFVGEFDESAEGVSLGDAEEFLAVSVAEAVVEELPEVGVVGEGLSFGEAGAGVAVVLFVGAEEALGGGEGVLGLFAVESELFEGAAVLVACEVEGQFLAEFLQEALTFVAGGGVEGELLVEGLEVLLEVLELFGRALSGEEVVLVLEGVFGESGEEVGLRLGAGGEEALLELVFELLA